jgi:hypothetical protein
MFYSMKISQKIDFKMPLKRTNCEAHIYIVFFNVLPYFRQKHSPQHFILKYFQLLFCFFLRVTGSSFISINIIIKFHISKKTIG